MAQKRAPAAAIEDVDVDDESLEDWGLDGIGEEDDDDPETGTSPEVTADDPADDPAPVETADDLPGDDVDEPEVPAAITEEGPSATADRPNVDAPAGAPEVKPWAFKADGKEVEVPRSQIFKAENPDGTEEEFVLFPAAEIQRTLHNHLADRGAWRNEKKGLLEQLAERDPQHNEDVVKARELTAFLFDLMDKSEDEILASIEKLKSGRPAWEAEQKAKALEARLAARDGVVIDPDPELERIQDEELESAMQTGLRSHVTELLKRPEFAGLDPEETIQDLWELRNHAFFEAGEDLPQYGLKKGQLGIDLGYLETRLAREKQRVDRIRARTTTAKTVARENRAALGDTVKPAAEVRKPASKKPKEEDFDLDAFLNDDDDI